MTVAASNEHAVIVRAMLTSFHKWATKHTTYGKVYKKIPQHYNQILEDAFVEMHTHTPSSADLWWVKNHMRYSKRLASGKDGKPIYREEHKRRVRELIYHFLTDYCRGKLD